MLGKVRKLKKLLHLFLKISTKKHLKQGDKNTPWNYWWLVPLKKISWAPRRESKSMVNQKSRSCSILPRRTLHASKKKPLSSSKENGQNLAWHKNKSKLDSVKLGTRTKTRSLTPLLMLSMNTVNKLLKSWTMQVNKLLMRPSMSLPMFTMSTVKKSKMLPWTLLLKVGTSTVMKFKQLLLKLLLIMLIW